MIGISLCYLVSLADFTEAEGIVRRSRTLSTVGIQYVFVSD